MYCLFTGTLFGPIVQRALNFGMFWCVDIKN